MSGASKFPDTQPVIGRAAIVARLRHKYARNSTEHRAAAILQWQAARIEDLEAKLSSSASEARLLTERDRVIAAQKRALDAVRDIRVEKVYDEFYAIDVTKLDEALSLADVACGTESRTDDATERARAALAADGAHALCGVPDEDGCCVCVRPLGHPLDPERKEYHLGIGLLTNPLPPDVHPSFARDVKARLALLEKEAATRAQFAPDHCAAAVAPEAERSAE